MEKEKKEKKNKLTGNGKKGNNGCRESNRKNNQTSAKHVFSEEGEEGTSYGREDEEFLFGEPKQQPRGKEEVGEEKRAHFACITSQRPKRSHKDVAGHRRRIKANIRRASESNVGLSPSGFELCVPKSKM